MLASHVLPDADRHRQPHVAVVARELDMVCLVGCAALEVKLAARVCCIGGMKLAEGAPISLDGNTGAIYAGALRVAMERSERELAMQAALTSSSAVGTGRGALRRG